jgi:hypothetical protein
MMVTMRTIAAVAVTVAGGVLICAGVILTGGGAVLGLASLVGFGIDYDVPWMLAYGLGAMVLGAVVVLAGPRVRSRRPASD